MAALFVAGMIMIGDDADAAPSDIAFYVSDAQGYEGETVSIEIGVSSNPGFAGLDATITYGGSELEFVATGSSFVQGFSNSQIHNMNSPSPGRVKLVFGDTSNHASEGPMAVLQFKIKAHGEVSPITLTLVSVSQIPAQGLPEDITPAQNSFEGSITSNASPSFVYGQKLSDFDLGAGYLWAAPDTPVGAPGEKAFQALRGGSAFDLPVAVGKAQLSASLVDGASYAYTGSPITPPAGDIALPGGISASEIEISSGAPDWNAGTVVTVAVSAKPSAANYQGSVSLTFTIQKAFSNVSVASDPSKTYDGAPVSDPSVSKTGDGAVSFEWYSGSARLSSAPSGAGSYSVRAVLSAGANYGGASSADRAFSIGKAAIAVSDVQCAPLVSGQRLSQSALSGTASAEGLFAWVSPDATVRVADSGSTFGWTYRPLDEANFLGASGAIAVTVGMAESKVTPIYSAASPVYETGSLPAISTSPGDTPGAISWDAYSLSPGAHSFGWTFSPADSTDFKAARGSAQFEILRTDLVSIEVSSPPSKASYVAFEAFDVTGMVVTARYSDGSSSAVSGYSVSPEVLTAGLAGVTVSFSDRGSVRTATAAVTVGKAAPAVNPVIAPGDVYDTLSLPEILLSDGDTAGSISWDACALAAGTGSYWWTFSPADPANYLVATGSAPVAVIADALTGIAVESPPSTLRYADGDLFSPAGMRVVASYLSGRSAEAIGYTVSPSALSYGDASVTVSYEYRGVIEAADVSVEVLYSVTYSVNGSVLYRDLYDEGDEVTLRPSHSASGYTVTPWSVPVQVSGGKFTMPGSNVGITATQAPDQATLFTVRYDANGGSFAGGGPADRRVRPDSAVEVQFSDLPSREGYSFGGWATSAGASSAEYASAATAVITSDVTFYAFWVADSPAEPPAPPEPPGEPGGGDGSGGGADAAVIAAIIAVALIGIGAVAWALRARRRI
ncbi:MAG: InlB B-repeat-containing protein [Candidatus Methanoplasma sp.]|nr:InlB B-repeat-containing protein [Candidatus Methanoplasma sp.]